MITSLSNLSIKHIRRLARDRKSRQESGQFFIEGLRIVGEAIQQGAPLDLLVFSPDLLVSVYGQGLVKEAIDQGCEVLEVSAEVFHAISQKDGPQGIAAVARQRWQQLDQLVLAQGDLWIALYQVADPGNLGAVIRTMDAVGGQGVILLNHATDAFDPAAVRASMGALFSQKLVRATFDEFRAWKQVQAVSIVGTSDAATIDYHGFSYPAPLVLLMGSERQGLPPLAEEICDALVSIPMQGVCDSLNLAVAAGVVLYEILNQRRETSNAWERAS